MRSRVAACSVWAGVAVALTPSLAHPSPEPRRTSTLSWVRLPGAERCVGPVELAAAVEARLGRVVFAPVSRAELAVEGRIEPRDGGFAAALSVSDREGRRLGQRELASKQPDCRAMDRALVLVTSLLIDPDAPLGTEAESPRGAPSGPNDPPPLERAETSTAPARPTPRASPPSAPVPLWGAVGLEGVVATGQLPWPSFGGTLALALGMQDGLRGRVTAVFGHGGAETAAGSPAAFTLLAGGAAACFAGMPRGDLSVGACAGGEIGGLLAAAAALSGEQDRSALWAAAVVGIHAELLLHRHWLLRGAVELGLPLRRDRFTYVDGAGVERVLFEPSPVLVRLGLGLGFRFLGS